MPDLPDLPDPPLRLRALLAALAVVLLVVGLSWHEGPPAARTALLAVPVGYLLLELGVFVRGLRRP